ncbi:MAG: PspA/IM30 family protein [Candidatus Aminicenantes bacterium]|nr:PspA/IM30 family protein [Candidatus Aminicenantes bacterium]NIM83628.1 PspA/IM30 family protein [Candidatus Aminicenantes bacterium]NIN23031.1 PspA/IM30 family protein [Candidatus Aminicenantes bacterium]NIN46767.1 PspA/IM30 family protein [Candidatus Aminicenantes bacterium]NIN89680.1 PspA/IM30 family protein [Candidatus Aminicenantes bacterium]
MGVFSRLFKVGQAEAHALVDKLEDPIKMTEQGIRDLKKDCQAAMESLAQVKALAIRMKKDAEDHKKQAAEYERKAMLLLQKMQGGELDAGEAERLATEALGKKEEAETKSLQFQQDYNTQKDMGDKLQVKVEKLKQTIRQYENDLVTLRARAKTAQSMRKINQQLSNVDSSGTIAMLEKMKTKVNEEESLAEAYGDISAVGGSVDEEIDKALEGPSAKTADSLKALKAKMGITETSQVETKP